MRSTAWIAILSGLFNCVIGLCTPSMLRWQIRQSMASFGAEHYTDMVIANQVTPVETVFLLHAACAFPVLVAGVLILLRRQAGVPLLIAAALLMAGLAVPDLVDPETIFLLVVAHICWWLFVAAFAFRKNRRCGAAWWHA